MESEMESISESLQRIHLNLQKNSHSKADWDAREALLDKERAEQEARQLRERQSALWTASKIPRRHSDFEIPENGAWRESFDTLKGKIGSGFLYVVMGNRGTGKTQLGTALIEAACDGLKSCLYVKALDVFIALREAYRKDGDAESQVIKRFIAPDLLIIDAMEERGETAFEDRLLNHIIDKRYDNLDDTLLITNQTPEAFTASAGPSIVSRIHETGDKIVCDWASFRTKPAARTNSALPVGDR